MSPPGQRERLRESGIIPPAPEAVTPKPAPNENGRAAVNQELVGFYWQIGEYISRKLASATWGEGVVEQLADHIARTHPDLRGFTRSNLLRMRQFYDTYRGDEKVAPLVRQLSWTHNLLILSPADGAARAVEQARAGASAQRCPVRACRPLLGKSVTTGDTIAPGRRDGAQGEA
jgi:hypothetical protein